MKTPALILGMILAFPAAASAEWVHAKGSYIFPPTMTEAEACQQAESRAKADAVRQVTGETLSTEDVMRCTDQGDTAECARNSTTWTAVGGVIEGERDKTRQTTALTVGAETFHQCDVSFEADVHVAEGRPDPSFTVGVHLNETVYRDGENLVVTVKPSQPMTVEIFQWLPYQQGDAQVSRIFPNQFDTQDRVTAPITVPTQAGTARYDLKVAFPAGMPPDRKMVDEYLMVVATKQPIAFRDSYSLDDFNKQIAEIPLDQRRIVRRAYDIVRGSQ